ncbi:DNA/RNA nuclease SfsA [Candidatus Hepatincolaceae symbiont of Richtersius coronifer]
MDLTANNSMPLIKGIFLKRYKRFFVEAQLVDTSEIITAHCPNTGSMLGLLNEGAAVYLSKAVNINNKLPYRLELIEASNKALVGVNTLSTNKIIREALQQNQIIEVVEYPQSLEEVKYEDSRLDFKLSKGEDIKDQCFMEIKSVTLSRTSGIAEFPDASTSRGLKHLNTLMQIAQLGAKAINLYLVQRSDVSVVRIAKDLDPSYYQGVINAKNMGVTFLAYQCEVSIKQIVVKNKIKIMY